MSRVTVQAGACGYEVAIDVEKVDRHTVRVALRSECKEVMAMQPEVAELNWRRGVFCRIAESRVYLCAAQHLHHAACPVPGAILKAIEVEVGSALPKDVTIHFE